MIFEKVRDMLAEQLEIEPGGITPETDIIEDLGADSLDVMELITSLENELDFVITDESINSLTTVGAIAEFIENILK